jgi:Saxitoxin biosynthesis operon protein SxtJ
LTLPDALTWLGALPFRIRILAVAAAVVLAELGLRFFVSRSRAYAAWTAFFKAIGVVWTAALLSVVYLLSVGPVGLIMRLSGKDPLDRTLHAEPSFWRAHEPNPLGPEQAARHQF